MVTIYFDKDGLYTQKSDISILEFKDYVDGYKNVLKAIYEKKDIIVVVRNRHCYSAFETMKNQYPANTLSFKKFSAKGEFLDKYGEKIPDYILESDLIKDKSYTDVEFSGNEGFENGLLRAYFGKFFVGKAFPFRLLGELCKNLSLDCLQNKDLIVLRKVFMTRIKTYVAACSDNNEEFMLTSFKEDFQQLKDSVGLYLSIKNYPDSFKEDVLGHDINKCFYAMRVSGEFIELTSDILETYKDKAMVFLHDLNIKRSDDFEKAINYLSGYYAFEFDWIMGVMDVNRNFITNDMIRLIKQKFSTYLYENGDAKDALESIKAPVTLQKPEANYDIEGWMDWALNSYLPYRFWLENTNRNDTQADEYASMYGDWMYLNYDKLVVTHPKILYKLLPDMKEDLLINDHSLIVILDNFNYKYVPELIQYMSYGGFNVISQEPVLAMIPTETKISKRAFFTGEAYNENQQSYEKLVQNWSASLQVSMKYLPDVGKLDKLDTLEEKVIFLNYLKIDEMLHEDTGTSALTIEKSIRFELKALIDIICKTLKRLQCEKNTNVYFIADHGSTKISAEQTNAINNVYYKDKAEDSDYRFISVNDTDFDKIKNSIGNLCYIFDRNRYGTEWNYLIAKGYNRFIKDDIKGYVHGGITPEENIVPFINFAYATEISKHPDVILENIELRYSMISNLSFMVRNYNDFIISNVAIEIKNPNIKAGEVGSVNIDGYSYCRITMRNVRITKSMNKANNEKMTVQIAYTANLRKHSIQIDLPMNMKSMQTNKVDLSDLF